MAEPIPQKPSTSDESKKDTVRINLPPGISKSSTGVSTSPPTVKTRPAGAPVSPEEEAKQETAVMGRPAAPVAPKSDTSRVAVPAAKPSAPAMPRPTVRLRREDDVPVTAAAPIAPATNAAPTMAPVVAAAPSGAGTGLAMAAMVVSLITLAYLAVVALA